MNTIKQMIAVAGLALAAFSTSAQADIVTYHFSGSVSSVTNTGFAGIALGESVSGTVSYDTNTPLNPYDTGNTGGGSYLLYSGQNFATNMNFVFSQSGMAYQSTASSDGYISVADNAAIFGNIDALGISSFGGGSDAYSMVHWNMFDYSGSAINGPGIPGPIAFSDFGYSAFTYYWTLGGSMVEAYVSMSSVSVSMSAVDVPGGGDQPVPEPASLLLLLIGMAGALFWVSRKAAAVK